jgi:hypothetical protein
MTIASSPASAAAGSSCENRFNDERTAEAWLQDAELEGLNSAP